jgi:hypothetical protein
MAYPGRKNRTGCIAVFSPRISRIEEDFTDNIGLIYQISGSPNW